MLAFLSLQEGVINVNVQYFFWQETFFGPLSSCPCIGTHARQEICSPLIDNLGLVSLHCTRRTHAAGRRTPQYCASPPRQCRALAALRTRSPHCRFAPLRILGTARGFRRVLHHNRQCLAVEMTITRKQRRN